MKEARGSSRSSDPGETPNNLSPGMATLLRAGKGGSRNEERTSPEQEDEHQARAAKDGKRLLKLTLVIADLLLVSLAARLVFKSGGQFGLLEGLLCAAALALGAWLSCLALWRKD